MFTYYSCFVVVFALTVIKSEYLGDTCELQSRSNGECVLFSQCQSAIRDKQDGKRPQLCGFQGIQPIVCCPNDDQSEDKLNYSKSRKKCQEYLQTEIQFPPGIINGIPAEAKEFPHMVALGYGPKNNIKWLCGGSLISKNFVLTAAHCVVSPDEGPVQWARMGTINLQEPEKGGVPQHFEIIDRYIHPEYRVPVSYNDIALLKLNQEIFPSEYVHPACINTEHNIEKEVEAIGWGRTGFAGSSSNNLLKVKLQIYNNETCRKSYINVSKAVLPNGIRDDLQVCAGGGVDESKDTCQGDSGGPLHELLKKGFLNIYNVIGVTSFGKGCGTRNVPGVYTRISHYVPWIESIIWP